MVDTPSRLLGGISIPCSFDPSLRSHIFIIIHINSLMNKGFLGQDHFVWFVGVVEDRHDPQKLGRVKVRCLGYHSHDKTKIKTADLPWAAVMQPVGGNALSGIGDSPIGIVEGSWVVGFFRDAESLQEPMIMDI